MEPLDPKLRRLIDAGMPAAMPEHDAHDRGLAALLAHIEGAPPPVPPASPAAAGLTKLLIGAAAVGAVAAGSWAATRASSDPAPAVQAAPTKPATPTPIVAPPGTVEPTPVPAELAEPAEPAPAASPPLAPARLRPKANRRTPAAATPSVSAADQLRAEADLIARAESALDRNKPREALALCDRHRKDYDAPQLTTERNAIAASAACMVQTDDTTAAEAFLHAHPKSALAKKVRQRCGLTQPEKKEPAP